MRFRAIAIVALALLMPSSLAASDSYSVQAATFSREVFALRATQSLRAKGLSCDYVKVAALYKVYCGRFSSKSDAAPMRDLVRQEGYRDAFYIITPDSGVLASTIAKPKEPAEQSPRQPEPVRTPQTKVEPPPAAIKPLTPPQPPITAPALKPLETAAPSVDSKAPAEKLKPIEPARPAPKVVEVKPRPAVEAVKPKPAPKTEDEIKRITADVLERNHRRFHPFAAASIVRSSNILFSEDNEQSDTITLGTLGIWAAVPAMKSNVYEETTSNITPGGWELPAFYSPGERRYQIYALYRMDSEIYANHDSLDFTGHKAQAHAEYNLKSDHSIILDDIYVNGHDSQDVGISNAINEYDSNMARLTLVLRPSPKTALELEGRTYSLSYDTLANSYKSRSDTLFRTSMDYKPFGKTSFGLEYARTQLDYDSPARSDRMDTDLLGRIKWEITGKTTGLVKIGSSRREFEGDGGSADSRLKVLTQLDYAFSPKTMFELKLWRYRNETDYSTADFAQVNKNIATIKWRLTGKTSIVLEDEYQTNEYIDTNPAPGEPGTIRTDKFNDILLKVRTQMRDWITLEAGYENQRRSSDLPGSTYKTDFWYTSVSLTF